MNWIVQNLWLIPALPLLAAGVTALAKRPQRVLAMSLAIGSMALAFLLSLCAFAHTLHPAGTGEVWRQVYNFNWLQFGDAWVQLGWVLDPLTAVMLLMVTFVGSLIFIYSIGYMEHDENVTRFFCFLSLFAAAMLGLVIANSLLLLFVCWELVGLSSYLLIGFWYHKPSAAAAAKKAFIVTRIGDIGFFLGILWLYAGTGTLLFYDEGNGCLERSSVAALAVRPTILGLGVSTAVSLLIFCGAIGKSGQVPLHVWLPDAMEGPTPVSALIHAATMVAAGVFLVARVYPLMAATPGGAGVAMEMKAFPDRALHSNNDADARPHPGPLPRARGQHSASVDVSPGEVREEIRPHPGPLARASGRQGAEVGVAGRYPELQAAANLRPLPGEEGRAAGGHSSPHGTSTALKAVTWIGAITAIFAALIAVGQSDIKRVLAYSTVSQLGYMMMGLGVGGVAVGMFHLITHAFFKALLFMGAGSVIHGCHEEQDIRRMGGLRRHMPVTFATYAIGMMALSGVPLFFSGFWSKDEILHAAWLWQPSKWPFVLGLAGAFLTEFYMTRQVCYVFFGAYRGVVRENAVVPEPGPGAAANPPSPHAGGHGDSGVRDAKPHESPAVMTVPLMILAGFSILLGFLGTPAWPWFQQYLGALHEEVAWGGVAALMAVSTMVVFAGIGIGAVVYGLVGPGPNPEQDTLEALFPAAFALVRDKFHVDELYDATVVRFNARFALLCQWLDGYVLDSCVAAISYVVLGLSWLNRVIDEYVVNLGFDAVCQKLRRGGRFASRLQDGQVQNYLRVLGLSLTVLLLLLAWGWGK
jgi:NADH:ubiquinone oxidoreductase subunit 5 (subunit L)/multisubunit Na+/H+ antiporter MnhA subunit